MWWGICPFNASGRQLSSSSVSGDTRLRLKCCKKPSRTIAFQDHSLASGTRRSRKKEVADEPRSGRPTTARTEENMDRVREVLHTDHRLSIQQIADTLHMSTFAVHGIMTEDLQMRKVDEFLASTLNRSSRYVRLSAIQHLANCYNVKDRTGTDILKILKRLSLSRQIHFQWIPSHVNIAGNEIADSLARASAGETTTPAAPLTYLKLFSNGHLLSLTFVDGIKHFEICTKCSSAQASPGHILSCLGLTRQDLVQDPILVLDFLRVNGPDLALLISGKRNNNNRREATK
ncbi:RNase H domain-containing protein [Trichonephila clavipes]|nr:RNase H domain-containing protein [Trichonephila clavipes]